MIANLILYQLGWAACVFGAANGFAPEGAVVAAAIVAWHIAQASRPGAEALLAAAAAVLGVVFESLLVAAGWVRVEDGIYWLVSLWALFATTLNLSLRALQTRPWIAAPLLLSLARRLQTP